MIKELFYKMFENQSTVMHFKEFPDLEKFFYAQDLPNNFPQEKFLITFHSVE